MRKPKPEIARLGAANSELLRSLRTLAAEAGRTDLEEAISEVEQEMLGILDQCVKLVDVRDAEREA